MVVGATCGTLKDTRNGELLQLFDRVVQLNEYKKEELHMAILNYTYARKYTTRVRQLIAVTP